MKNMELISYLAMATIVISLFFIGTELTGFALIETGAVNVTIDTSASIVFSTSLLDFGNGTITPGQTAIIDSEGGNVGSYWSGTAPSTGLILENNGNVNVSFTLMANKTVDSFLGGTTPVFELKVSNEETGSCGDITTNFSSYASVTTSEQLACGNFGSQDSEDTVAIDVRLTMNDDASGAKTVGITATATAV